MRTFVLCIAVLACVKQQGLTSPVMTTNTEDAVKGVIPPVPRRKNLNETDTIQFYGEEGDVIVPVKQFPHAGNTNAAAGDGFLINCNTTDTPRDPTQSTRTLCASTGSTTISSPHYSNTYDLAMRPVNNTSGSSQQSQSNKNGANTFGPVYEQRYKPTTPSITHAGSTNYNAPTSYRPEEGGYPEQSNSDSNRYRPATQGNRETPQGNYSPAQGNYGPSEGNHRPAQGNYEPPQGNYSPPPGHHPAPQGSYGSSTQGNNRPTQGSYRPLEGNSGTRPQGNQGPPQGNYGSSQGNKIPTQGNSGSPQGNREETPQGNYGSPQGNHGTPQENHPAPQGNKRPTQGNYRPPEGNQDPPQGSQGPPQGSYRPPQGNYGSSQGNKIPTQGRPPQGNPGSPQRNREETPQGNYRPPQGNNGPPQGNYERPHPAASYVSPPGHTSNEFPQRPVQSTADLPSSSKKPSGGNRPGAGSTQSVTAAAASSSSSSSADRPSSPPSHCECMPDTHCMLLDSRIVTPEDEPCERSNHVRCCLPDVLGPPPKCGVRSNLTIPDVALRPYQAPFAFYPWSAILLGSEGQYLGGGAVLDDLHVVTAAHKINAARDHLATMKVRLGEWDASFNNEPYSYEEFGVAEVHIHPHFNEKNLQYDVAVVTLDRGIEFRRHPHIRHVCLPKQNVTFVGQRCWVAGWGQDAFGTQGAYQRIIKHVDVPIIDSDECELRLRDTKLSQYFELHRRSFICAGGEMNKDACTGDGGSSLVCEDPETHQFFLAGLVAWGIGCATHGIPGVYVNIASFSEWIADFTSNFKHLKY